MEGLEPGRSSGELPAQIRHRLRSGSRHDPAFLKCLHPAVRLANSSGIQSSQPAGKAFQQPVNQHRPFAVWQLQGFLFKERGFHPGATEAKAPTMAIPRLHKPAGPGITLVPARDMQDGAAIQFRVTFTFTNSLGAAVPVTVAVTVVVPGCGVSGRVVMATVVSLPSVVPLSLKVVKSFDH